MSIGALLRRGRIWLLSEQFQFFGRFCEKSSPGIGNWSLRIGHLSYTAYMRLARPHFGEIDCERQSEQESALGAASGDDQ